MPLILRGRIRIVPISDVDTDMIFHNRHLHITDRGEMGKFIFGNLKGFEGFPATVQQGDILAVGSNFGCGSSRQQAVDGLLALGISAVIGESFGAIYRRNAINAALPLIECPGVLRTGFQEGEEALLDLGSGRLSTVSSERSIIGKPLTSVQKDIYFAGGLLELV